MKTILAAKTVSNDLCFFASDWSKCKDYSVALSRNNYSEWLDHVPVTAQSVTIHYADDAYDANNHLYLNTANIPSDYFSFIKLESKSNAKIELDLTKTFGVPLVLDGVTYALKDGIIRVKNLYLKNSIPITINYKLFTNTLHTDAFSLEKLNTRVTTYSVYLDCSIFPTQKIVYERMGSGSFTFEELPSGSITFNENQITIADQNGNSGVFYFQDSKISTTFKFAHSAVNVSIVNLVGGNNPIINQATFVGRSNLNFLVPLPIEHYTNGPFIDATDGFLLESESSKNYFTILNTFPKSDSLFEYRARGNSITDAIHLASETKILGKNVVAREIIGSPFNSKVTVKADSLAANLLTTRGADIEFTGNVSIVMMNIKNSNVKFDQLQQIAAQGTIHSQIYVSKLQKSSVVYHLESDNLVDGEHNIVVTESDIDCTHSVVYHNDRVNGFPFISKGHKVSYTCDSKKIAVIVEPAEQKDICISTVASLCPSDSYIIDDDTKLASISDQINKDAGEINIRVKSWTPEIKLDITKQVIVHISGAGKTALLSDNSIINIIGLYSTGINIDYRGTINATSIRQMELFDCVISQSIADMGGEGIQHWILPFASALPTTMKTTRYITIKFSGDMKVETDPNLPILTLTMNHYSKKCSYVEKFIADSNSSIDSELPVTISGSGLIKIKAPYAFPSGFTSVNMTVSSDGIPFYLPAITNSEHKTFIDLKFSGKFQMLTIPAGYNVKLTALDESAVVDNLRIEDGSVISFNSKLNVNLFIAGLHSIQEIPSSVSIQTLHISEGSTVTIQDNKLPAVHYHYQPAMMPLMKAKGTEIKDLVLTSTITADDVPPHKYTDIQKLPLIEKFSDIKNITFFSLNEFYVKNVTTDVAAETLYLVKRDKPAPEPSADPAEQRKQNITFSLVSSAIAIIVAAVVSFVICYFGRRKDSRLTSTPLLST